MTFVIWFIGKSSAGKTAIGKCLYQKLKEKFPLAYLDGDELRDAISWDLSHSLEHREISEKRRSGLSKLLYSQNISVICSGISNSSEIREWNKKNIDNYFEIYIKVKQEVLYARDAKGIYKKFNNNEISDVVGEDIPFVEPSQSWLTVDNNGDKSIDTIVKYIIKELESQKII